MKTLKLLAALLLSGYLFAACESKGAPHEIGQLLTPEQVAEVAGDDSWNGKLVTVQGYPQFAKKVVRLDSKNPLGISVEPGGPELIRATVSIKDASRNSIGIGGEKSRNYASLTKEQSLAEATFMLDDYTESSYGEFLFSGTLVYDGGQCTLENVSIHPVQ